MPTRKSPALAAKLTVVMQNIVTNALRMSNLLLFDSLSSLCGIATFPFLRRQTCPPVLTHSETDAPILADPSRKRKSICAGRFKFRYNSVLRE